MTFTFRAYEHLLTSLALQGYRLTDYLQEAVPARCAILRHDVDLDLKKACAFADLEASLGVRSTYFIMLSSSFYNLHTREAREHVAAIARHHDIGLHFDETVYAPSDSLIERAEEEAAVMRSITGLPIRSVSMHRPSANTLQCNYSFPTLINSYGRMFFEEYTYVSDSRGVWRQDPLALITSGRHDRLHILTHPIWYRETEADTPTVLSDFLGEATEERYRALSQNIRDLPSLLPYPPR